MPERRLDESDLDPDWNGQFARWFAEAGDVEPEPEAMALATSSPEGRVSVRFVLLKAFGPDGFVFYTNDASPKAQDLAANPRAALAWRWRALDRQVRVAGQVEPVEGGHADSYFASRPRGSQLGAWASRQSTPLADRYELAERVAAAARRFEGGAVPRPVWWGGWRVAPDEVEFWQGRPDRLHDRFRYRRQGERWLRERLSP